MRRVTVVVLAAVLLVGTVAAPATANEPEPERSPLCQAAELQRTYLRAAANPEKDWGGYIEARDAFWKAVALNPNVKAKGWSGWKISEQSLWEARQEVGFKNDRGWVGNGECR